ncbi:hypothetical protein EDD86DRAFT_212326 [Gorgonomyces haynaldii]|nr:hypothetical protein EDD86DRAFT_212326 [Gorgonomyces haynaldii]
MTSRFPPSMETDPESIVATFQTLAAEGDLLLQRGSYHEAIDVYTKALEIRPDDKHSLVCRGRCYIQIGNPQQALKDANECLKDKPDFFKGIYLKAEALYAQGDFEMALLFYHRGNRLRPELAEFRIGIQKSREAIDNAIGDSKRLHITVPDKLRKNWLGTQSQDKPNTPAQETEHKMTPSMEAKLLGELFDDKVYLNDLLHDKDFIDYPDENVLGLVNEGLRYLNTRLDFWRQQHPLYARNKAKRIHCK